MLISAAGPVASFAIYWATRWFFLAVPYAHKDPMLLAFLPLLATANFAWGFFNLLSVAALSFKNNVRNFFRLFLADRTAFIIAVWIGMIAALAAAIFFVRAELYFAALLMGWFVIINWQQWSYFRTHGYPGD